MLPDNVLSSKAVVQGYPDPVKQPGDFLVDWERAGKGLRDPSDGLLVQVWRLDVERDADNVDLWHFNVSAPNFPKQTVFSHLNVTEASLSFDQNMNPFIVFMAAGLPYMYWYDSSIPEQVVVGLPPGVKSPRCTIDDKRPTNFANSDNLLAYIRGGNLCVCYQRDRYGVEHVLCEVGQDAELVSCAMTAGSRVQFRVRKVTANVSDGRFLVQTDPFLSDILLDLCSRSGIPLESVDVNGLYGQIVPGLKVEVDQGLDKPIDWLREVFNFDKCNSNKKIRFVPRGGPVRARIPYEHLLEGNPQALAVKIRDQSKLPTSVEVVHLDPTGGYAKNSQRAFRRSNTINAKAKPKIETTVVLTPDQAATAATVRLKKDWNELRDYSFSTGIRYAFLTESDVVEVEDAGGTWNRMRIEEKNEDDGELKWTCVQDAGPSVYGTSALGNFLDDPVSTTPGLVGPTDIEIVNCSPLRDQDDELGVYIAAAGSTSAWTGFTMLVSTDGGQSYSEAYEASSPATIGTSETDLLADDYLYQGSAQILRVVVNFPLSSANYDQVLSNANRCAIGDEVIQFTTATLVDQPDGKYRYDLGGLVRGRYNTVGDHWPAGTRFVLLDESLVFVRAQQWMLGRDIDYKPVTNGSNVDETVATSYLFDDPQSQIEWPPYSLSSSRSGGDLTVSWIGKARLGLDTDPYHSKYFAGYRVKFSNGHTIDTTDQSAVYSGAPSGITFTVCGLNSITGEGQPSLPAST